MRLIRLIAAAAICIADVSAVSESFQGILTRSLCPNDPEGVSEERLQKRTLAEANQKGDEEPSVNELDLHNGFLQGTTRAGGKWDELKCSEKCTIMYVACACVCFLVSLFCTALQSCGVYCGSLPKDQSPGRGFRLQEIYNTEKKMERRLVLRDNVGKLLTVKAPLLGEETVDSDKTIALEGDGELIYYQEMDGDNVTHYELIKDRDGLPIKVNIKALQTYVGDTGTPGWFPKDLQQEDSKKDSEKDPDGHAIKKVPIEIWNQKGQKIMKLTSKGQTTNDPLCVHIIETQDVVGRVHYSQKRDVGLEYNEKEMIKQELAKAKKMKMKEKKDEKKDEKNNGESQQGATSSREAQQDEEAAAIAPNASVVGNQKAAQ